MIDFLKNNFVYIAAIITALKWIYEYSQKLKWEKNKFLLDKLEQFNNDPDIQNVYLILDWNAIKINTQKGELLINDKILLEALLTHDEKHSFNETESYLRKAFDEYFDGLTQFIVLSECGMINKNNFKVLNKYWLDILNGKKINKSVKISEQYKKYMLFYGYDKLYDFIHN